ncbi:MAG: rod shape-determining protein RodA [Nitrospirae bacterium]|nr:rod shape-determining protein RodA [Nitrospirota bacterium]
MTVDRRFIEHFDWVLLLSVLLISAAGVLTIYSASATPYGPQPTLYLRQIYWIGVGLVIMLAAASIDLNTLRRLGPVFYAAAVILLVSVLAMGRVGMGARRWVQAGPVSFQPSEFAKVFLIFWLASHLADRPPSSGLRLRDLARPAALLALPFLLVLKQPDLGTAAILFFVAVTMFVAAGVRLKPLLALAAASGGAFFLMWPALWGSLKEYQRQRILVYLAPESDPLGMGYHISQSKIAIGSGGFWGKGYLAGTQGHLAFLPERHTDFIFAVFVEEWGFLGAIALLGLIVFFVVWSAEIAYRARHRFDMLLSAGVTALFAWYTLVNLGMTMGLTPVVGVPLPFMSYGGSSVAAGFAAVGVLMNVRLRRFRIFG